MTDMPRSHELLDDWTDVITRQLIASLKLSKDQAQALGVGIAQALAAEFAGQQIYVPAFYSAKIAEKHRVIYDEYLSKADSAAICRRHDITERTLYRILARMGAADVSSRQLEIFSKPNRHQEQKYGRRTD